MRGTRLSKEEKNELSIIMSKGNALLKQCAEMMELKHREFRGKLFSQKLDTSKLSTEQLNFLNSSIPHILEVRHKCESKLLAGFERMVQKQAYLAARNNHDPYAAKQEFVQEGTIALLDAIYGYTNLNIKLTTFFWSCVRNRLLDAIKQMNPLCPLTNEAMDIIRRVEEGRSQFDGPVTDEKVVETIGLTTKERKVFFSAMTRVINEEASASEDEMSHDDYTSKRRGIDSDLQEVFFVRKEARQAVKDAELDDFEMECLFADMFEYHGWKEDVASKHVNKKTGKRFTRQSVQHALSRAQEKVRDAYMNPPKVHKDNPRVDELFNSWDAEKAVQEDQQTRGK